MTHETMTSPLLYLPFPFIWFNRCYECGVGTSVDDGLALDWLEKAAEAEHPQALATLANRYTRGIGYAHKVNAYAASRRRVVLVVVEDCSY